MGKCPGPLQADDATVCQLSHESFLFFCRGDVGKWGADAALWGASLAERLRRALGSTVDRYNRTLQPVAEVLGRGLRERTPEKTPEAWSVMLFTEEVVRGGISFVLSVAARKLERAMRDAGHLPAWQVISAGPSGGCGGVLKVVPDMASVQHNVYDVPTVLLSRSVSGEEEVPLGVTCVITPGMASPAARKVHAVVMLRHAPTIRYIWPCSLAVIPEFMDDFPPGSVPLLRDLAVATRFWGFFAPTFSLLRPRRLLTNKRSRLRRPRRPCTHLGPLSPARCSICGVL